ncbi:MAG: hypothetical protein ACON3Z_15380 [Bradymonadia bacterium]
MDQTTVEQLDSVSDFALGASEDCGSAFQSCFNHPVSPIAWMLLEGDEGNRRSDDRPSTLSRPRTLNSNR